MEAIVPYLNFNGNAGEALEFYSKALNGKVLFQQTYGESSMETRPEFKDKIMHGSLQAGELVIMVSDANEKFQATAGSNVSLSLNFTDPAEMDKTFESLSRDGQITMPLQDTFWGARFGMLTDKFGFHWMFNHDKVPQEDQKKN